MCGINGFNFHNQYALLKMNERIKHRGPDDTGTFVAPGISLGHNRLSIIDLSSAGHQPMTSADGRYTITFNGEIYNFLELREEFEKGGARFRSKTDTEVLLRAYSLWGADCLKKLNGIFAFAVWDRDKEELFLARDHLGVKPLYYFWDDKQFIFSSEIKAILAHDVPREINTDALNIYFRFLYVPAPLTIWKKIFKLPAGHFALLKKSKLTIKKYWEISRGAPINSREGARAAIKEIVRDSVRRELISDRPLGVFLSGGIDSSAVLGVMREFASGAIKTFSAGFDVDVEEEKYNADFRLAKRTSRYFNTEHHALKITAADVRDCFEKVIYHMDEPVSNHIQPATYLLSRFAKEKVDVVLGGDGGDELFGGYDRYFYNSVIDRVNSLPSFLRTSWLLNTAGKITGKKSLMEKVRTKKGLERFLSFMAQKEAAVGGFLKSGFNRPAAVPDFFGRYFHELWEEDFTNQMMAVDASTWLPDESLVRSDKLTMASALEERVPLLDYRLAEFAFRTPSQYKVYTAKQGKRILREALHEYVPDFVLKEKKRGWFSPASKWLRTGLKDFAYEILSPNFTETRDIFDFIVIKKMLDDHIEKRKYALPTIWSLLTFQMWHKLFTSGK